jgi:hypothetical protein
MSMVSGARPVLLGLASVVLSRVMVYCHFPDLSSCVGIASPLFYGFNPVVPFIVAVVATVICSFSDFPYFVINPFFLCHLAVRGSDHIFIAPLLFFLNTRFATVSILITAVIRHFFVDPSPSISLFWSLDVHFYTDFRSEARITVIVLQLVSIYLSRHFSNAKIGLLLYFISDSCGDWAGFALLLTMAVSELNQGPLANASFLLLLIGFWLNQAAFYAWWSMGIGNANFPMIGSILYTIGIIVLLFHFTRDKSFKTD